MHKELGEIVLTYWESLAIIGAPMLIISWAATMMDDTENKIPMEKPYQPTNPKYSTMNPASDNYKKS